MLNVFSVAFHSVVCRSSPNDDLRRLILDTGDLLRKVH